MENPRASLLGLPTELRLKIYDLLLNADIDYRFIRDIYHIFDSHGTQAALLPDEVSKDFQSMLPWLNLSRCCRQIYYELRPDANKCQSSSTQCDRTYELDLDVFRGHGPLALRTATWRHIPCAPSQVTTMIINVNVGSGPGPWTDGGPASLARAIFQILNRTFHLGPHIFRNSLLPEHMELRDLCINVDIGRYADSNAQGCHRDPRLNWFRFQEGWKEISRTGFLTGFVERTRLRSVGDGSEEVEVPATRQEWPTPVGYWRGYGFQWGIECAGYRTL
jgi:hypothetical protein